MKKILKIFIGFLLFGFLSFGLSLQAASSDTYSIYPTNISNVPNKAKLDAFLNKVLDTRKEFSSDSNYLVFLNKISEKLDSLSSSYGSNTQVKTMITYLKSGVNNIITLTKQNTDVDSFFCELFGDCESTTPICPVYSLVAPPEGCNYVYEKDANGCDVPKLSCGGVCTKEYSPVCAQPPMPPCPDGMSCTQAFPALKTYGNKCEANSAKATIQYEGECKNTTSSFNGGMLNGLIYIKSNQNGTLTNGETAFSNTKLDSVKSPFTGISCPNGYERVGIGLRIEENGAQNFQVFTCVKKQGNIDYSSMPKGTLMGLIYIPSNELGTLTNGENALSNTKLDSVRLPFTGISCPSGFERVGIGMRKEENGTQNYQVYTCVKTSGTTDYSKVSTGTMMGLIYIPSNELGTLTNGETAFSNTKLDLVKSPFTGISCPSGFERVGIGMRKEENGTKNYQVYTCVKTSVPTSSCSWQYHFVVGPVGQLDIDPNTTSCTTSLNGKSSYEISGNKQKVATCACTGGVDPVPETTNFKISGVDNGETIAITYNIDKSLGYKQCVLTAGDKEEMVSIVNGTVSVGNGSTSGLGNIGSNQSFSGTKYYKKGQFLNLYCAKVENAKWTQMEKIISPVIIDRTVSSPITTLKVSQIPGNTTSSSPSCSWQYHAVFGPVGPVDIDPNTTTCNSSLNGKSSYEISGSKQKVATCACTGGEYPQPNNGKIYISNTSGNDLSKLNGTAYLDKQLYVILDGVDKSNPPKGCAKLAGTAGCNTPSGFRDYLSHEWVSNTRIVSEGANGIAPNTFPAGDYEFYSLYGTTITKIGTGKLIASPSSCSWQYHAVFGPVGPLDINPNTTSCTTSLNGRSAYEISGSKQKVATCNCTGTDIPSTGFTGAETVTLGNTFPTYGNSACIEQNLYNVFGGLKKSSNPKGCAQLAGTNACNNPSVFRNFTANEWVSDTTVLTQASAGSFPAGNYEFFLMYGTEIRKVGSGSLKQCNTAKVLNQSDVSTFIDNTRNELNNDAAAFVKIALEVLKYEREGYTGLRQQVASHLGITTNDVKVYINAVISKGAGELYVESYADLQAAFNSNNLGLTKNSFGINHYEKYGRSEGRYFPQK